MLDDDLLAILICPETHAHLRRAEDHLIQELNAVIAAGRLNDRKGRRVEKSLEAGLVREDGLLLYPVFDGIPVLLVDEAIPLSQLEDYRLPPRDGERP
jgi:uncharacterized protein YbaR (Trm112 family)